MYKKKDLKIGAIIQDCKIIAENDNEYTLECVHCHKLYYKKYDLLRKRKLAINDFVYIDPPYLNTTAVYNENGGWTEKDEDDLYELCEQLNNNNIKWAMSNVFENKGVKNNRLIEWCDKNNWNVYTFDGFTYCACGKGNSNAKEVLIRNY